jgi:hypothetical protein
MKGLPPDLEGVNYARILKVTKAERLKDGFLMHVLFGIKAFQASGKKQIHVFGQGLLPKQKQYDYFY